MLRAVALRFESGAITSTSTPSSSRRARRAACSPGAEIPSSLVSRTRTDLDSRWPRDSRSRYCRRCRTRPARHRIRRLRLPRLGAAAGPAHGAGRAGGGAGDGPARAGRADRRRAHRHRRPRAAARSRASRPRPSVPGDLARRLNGLGPDDIARHRGARSSPTASTPAATPRSRTYRYRVLARSRPEPLRAAAAPSGGRTGSTARRSTPAPPPCRAPTTSPPSPRPRPTTSASSATSSPPPGSRTATSSPSASPPTPSCATWSASSSAPARGRQRPPHGLEQLRSAARSEARRTALPHGQARTGAAPHGAIPASQVRLRPQLRPARGRPSRSSPTCRGPSLTIRV